MATVPLVSDAAASPEVAAVFADIRETRGTEHINNFWRALAAADPALLAATWARLKAVMVEQREGGLDPLTKELVYLAVSMANGCDYCIHSHTAAARAKGASAAQLADLYAVLAMAVQTNALVTALGVPVDPGFQAEAD
ncbi:carboxymuconolactone decarboxylase family protein [Paralimibaculum aggregatum]|uniref:Carboxymuconolactone decarboxylase family protein n=1 Tax=Paralimibaculum aggregatum TaxID=3036245 RepID=A0ABQ6LF65_9RHOB|nr:carboxymuconolactone decarboxylase family protein [Limibaculum sp. NKW23]GMG81979.1 carboxymuconolactone decarboxylase family protein [Limibaculum sp. NKW23]